MKQSDKKLTKAKHICNSIFSVLVFTCISHFAFVFEFYVLHLWNTGEANLYFYVVFCNCLSYSAFLSCILLPIWYQMDCSKVCAQCTSEGGCGGWAKQIFQFSGQLQVTHLSYTLPDNLHRTFVMQSLQLSSDLYAIVIQMLCNCYLILMQLSYKSCAIVI